MAPMQKCLKMKTRLTWQSACQWPKLFQRTPISFKSTRTKSLLSHKLRIRLVGWLVVVACATMISAATWAWTPALFTCAAKTSVAGAWCAASMRQRGGAGQGLTNGACTPMCASTMKRASWRGWEGASSPSSSQSSLLSHLTSQLGQLSANSASEL